MDGLRNLVERLVFVGQRDERHADYQDDKEIERQQHEVGQGNACARQPARQPHGRPEIQDAYAQTEHRADGQTEIGGERGGAAPEDACQEDGSHRRSDEAQHRLEDVKQVQTLDGIDGHGHDDGQNGKKVIYALMERENADRFLRWCRKANRLFAGFTTGKIVDSIVIGILCYIIMLILGLEYATLISVIVGITNVLPFFGPFIGAIPSILILAIVNPASALKFAILILVLQQLDGNVIGPKILGDYVGISPMLTMGAILVGSGLWGFTGLLISVPLCALAYAIIQSYVDGRLTAKGLSTHTHFYDGLPEELEEPHQRKPGYFARVREAIRKRKK